MWTVIWDGRGREQLDGNWVPYVVALAGTEIETCGKRTRIERARERGREGFPSHPHPGIHYRQFPPDRLSALLLSFSLLPLPAHSDLGSAASLVPPLFRPSSAITQTQRPPDGRGRPSLLSRSEPRLPAATGPRNSVTYFNVFPQPATTTDRPTDRPLLSLAK